MTWNIENFFQPQPADQADFDAKLDALAEVIMTAEPDLLAVQEVGDEVAFAALRDRLGAGWNGELSTHFESSHAIRVGWLSPGELSDVQEVIELPGALAPVKVEDDGTTMTQLGRGAVAVTATTATGVRVRALTVHLKSKLLSFPGGRFDTTDEDELARYGVYALNRRAAEAAAVRHWATTSLAAPGRANRCWSAATSTTPWMPPPPSYCSGRPDPSSAPAGSTDPTGAMPSGCGMSATG